MLRRSPANEGQQCAALRRHQYGYAAPHGVWRRQGKHSAVAKLLESLDNVWQI